MRTSRRLQGYWRPGFAPPCASRIELEIASPIPMPELRVVKNGSNSRGRLSSQIPAPESFTATTTLPSGSTRDWTMSSRLPLPINLTPRSNAWQYGLAPRSRPVIENPCYNHEHRTVPSVSSHLPSDMRIFDQGILAQRATVYEAHGNVIHALAWTHAQLAAHSSGPAESRLG